VQSDLEKEHDYSKLGEIMNHWVGRVENAEKRFSEENSRNQLTHNRRLTQSLCDKPEELRRYEQRKEDGQ